MRLVEAGPADVPAVRELFLEYAAGLGFDLGFQDFESELARLPVPSMAAAQRLYESLGFREIEAYRYNPIPGTRFMELTLQEAISA